MHDNTLSRKIAGLFAALWMDVITPMELPFTTLERVSLGQAAALVADNLHLRLT
ncbi:hypothetical protein [Azospirillum sp. INR13]|uniref:hypothetical protein n=1 Tax=Azospirillum sp. INR13 TaxID=2596919 RepID=UPI0018923421|nr:hypothetical protein [Azospirillum sp. INR13]